MIRSKAEEEVGNRSVWSRWAMRVAMDGECPEEEAQSPDIVKEQAEAAFDKYIPKRSFFEKRAEVRVANTFFEKR